MTVSWLIVGLMLLLAGGATMLVGHRAPELGLPRWLSQAILATGLLVSMAGLMGLIWVLVQLARWLW